MIGFFSDILDSQVFSVESVNGGDINEAFKIKTADGIYFAKVNRGLTASQMLRSESKGLLLLNSITGVRVPEVIKIADHENHIALILTWIETGKAGKNTSEDLAAKLSLLHHTTSQNFGLDYDNFIGSLAQVNTNFEKWIDFYYHNRISPQIKWAVESGNIPVNYTNKIDKVFKNLENEMPEVIPSLLHGDLWSGNYMIDQDGKAILIDPAVYYGHREMDIAMMKLFGGFPAGIYDIYNEFYKFDNNWENRIRFYQLYYVLVHVNLFGSSYSGSAINIIDSYL